MFDDGAVGLGLQRDVQDCPASVRVEDDGEDFVGIRNAHRTHGLVLAGILEADLLELTENLRDVKEGGRRTRREHEAVSLLFPAVCERNFVQFVVLCDAAVT